MGKFKDGLTKLKKSLEEVQPEIDKVYGGFAPTLNSLTNAGMHFSGGYETAYMYLGEKFKKNKDTFANNSDKTLKEVLDPNLAKFVQEIEGARQTCLKHRTEYDRLRTELKTILKKNEALKTQIADLKTSLGKKKKKLLQTKNYKAKVANYEKTLGELETVVEQWGSILKNPPKVLALKFLQNSKLSVATTLKEIEASAGAHVDTEIKQAEEAATNTVKKFRARNIKNELEFVKKWVAEADEMENESGEGT